MTPIEAIHLSITSIEEHLGDDVAALCEVRDIVLDHTERLENQRVATRDMADELIALRSEVGELATLLRNFISDTNRLRAQSAQLQSEVREKLKVNGG